MNGYGRIMPREKGAASLDVVIAVMAFLAALAVGAVLIAERAATSWRTGLADRVTVQIVPTEKPLMGTDEEIGAAMRVLQETPGVARVTVLSERDTISLITPWLGSNTIIPDLPLPRLIDATLAPGERVDLTLLKQRLKQAAPNSMLDDHTRWLVRLQALAQGITWSVYGILALIALATAATISFATRAGLAAHSEIVELLHQMGAQAGFIARAFEWHYFVAAFFAGAIGAGLAGALYVAGGGLDVAGVPALPFLPPLGLRLSELGWLLVVPVAASWIALLTARVSVLGVLSRIY